MISIHWPFLLISCGPLLLGIAAESKGEKMLTREQATEIARREFAKKGRSEGDYDISVKNFSATNATEDFVVWFTRKGPFRTPGGDHAVRINRATGEAVFLQGE